MAAPGWTPELLKEHYDALRVSDQAALLSALASLNKRLDVMNEFRSTISDQTAEFARRETVDAQIVSINERLANTAGRGTGMKEIFGYILSIVVAAVAVAAYLTK